MPLTLRIYFLKKQQHFYNFSIILFFSQKYQRNKYNSSIIISTMNNDIKDLITSFHSAFSDQETVNQYAPLILSSIDQKTSQIDLPKFRLVIHKFLDQFSQQLEDNYDNIINLLQGAFQTDDLNKEIIITYWIYYFFVQADPTKQSQLLLKKIYHSIEERRSLPSIIEDIITNYHYPNEVKQWINQQITKRRIYELVEKLLFIDNSLPQQKINENHQDLIFILKMTQNYHHIGQVQIYRHILVQFQNKYHLSSQQGKKAKKQLLDYDELESILKGKKQQIRKAFRELKRQNASDKLSILKKIYSLYVSFDTFLFKRLIMLSREKFQQQQNSRKKIVFIVGQSGSGKTTIMLRLLGYDLKNGTLKGMKTLIPQGLKRQHFSLRTSPQSQSVTRYLFLQQIPSQFFLPGQQEYYICDTPGFGDSAGPEVDASNMISIKRAVEECRAIKILVVISQKKIGDRYDGIKNIGKIIANMIPNFKIMEQKQSVEIMLNKFISTQQIVDLGNGINSIISNLTIQQKSNESYKQFLKFLQTKIQLQKQNIQFHPDISKQTLTKKLNVHKMISSQETINYSWSQETKKAVLSRQNTLIRYIKQQLKSKQKHKAFYYLSELSTISQCFQSGSDFKQNFQQIKKQIKHTIEQRYDYFCTIINEQISKNDANKSSFQQISKISEDIKQFEIFSTLIQDIRTSSDISKKVDSLRQQHIETIRSLKDHSIDRDKTKKTIVNILKFSEKLNQQTLPYLCKSMEQIYKNSVESLYQNICQRQFTNLSQSYDHTLYLLEIFDKLEKQLPIIKTKKYLQIDIQKEKNQLAEELNGQFKKIVDRIKSQFTKSMLNDQIPCQHIQETKDMIAQLQKFRKNGPKIENINITQELQSLYLFFGNIIQTLVKQINDKLAGKDISHSDINEIKSKRKNINSIVSFYPQNNQHIRQINRLISKITQYIHRSKETLTDLKRIFNDKNEISKNNLRAFNKSYRIVLIICNDQEFQKPRAQLIRNVRKTLQSYINDLQIKSYQLKILLKQKKTLTLEKILQAQKIIFESEAFYRTKQFEKQQYLCFSKKDDIQISKLQQQKDSSDEEYEQIKICQDAETIYKKTIQKLLYPFKQIHQLVKKVNNSNLSDLNLVFIDKLVHFQCYKNKLQNRNDLIRKRYFIQYKKDLDQQENYRKQFTLLLQKLNSIIISCKNLIDNESNIFVDNHKFAQLKQLKVPIIFLLNASKYDQICQLVIQCQFDIHDLISIIEGIFLKISTQLLDLLSQLKKQDKKVCLNKLKCLKQKTQNILFGDILFKNRDTQNSPIDFKLLLKKIECEIEKIKQKKEQQIDRLFDENNFMIKDIIQAYSWYEDDKQKKDENIKYLNRKLIYYANQRLKVLKKYMEEYFKQQKLAIQGLNAMNYFGQLDELFKIFIGLQTVFNTIHNFPINKAFFIQQLFQLKLGQRMKQTADSLQQKIENFSFKGKQREFQKTLTLLRKVQTLHNAVFNRPGQKISYTDKLKQLKIKTDSQFTFKDQSINIDAIFKENFLNFYNKIDKNSNQKEIYDSKLQKAIAIPMNQYIKSFNKSQKQIASYQQKIRKIISHLPPSKLKQRYEKQFKDQKINFKQKAKLNLQRLSNVLEEFSLENLKKIFQIIKQTSNQEDIKQYLGFFQKHAKQMKKNIICLQHSKRVDLFKSLKKYITFFGKQNDLIINDLCSLVETRQIFQSLHNDIIREFSQQLKDSISQLIQQMNKNYIQNCKSFQEKCKKILKFWLLLLENIKVRDQSKFSAMQEQWNIFLSLIKKSLSIHQIYCRQLSLTFEEFSVKIFQKTISDLKMIKVFQESGSHQLQSLKTLSASELKNKSRILQQIINNKTLQQFTITIVKSLLNLKKTLQVFSFYDEFIKFQSTVVLEDRFQKKIIHSINIIKQIEQISKKYMIDGQLSGKNSESLIKQIQKRWQQELKSVIKQFQSTIYDPNEEISQKINVYHRQLQIFEKRQWTIINKNSKSIQIQNVFNQNFENIKNRLSNHKKFFCDYRKQRGQFKIKNDLEMKNIQYQDKIAQKDQQKQQQEKNFQFNQAQDENNKQKIILQLQNIIKISKQQRQKPFLDQKKKFQDIMKKHQNNLEQYVKKKFVPDLIIMKKYSQTINSKTNIANNFINDLLIELCKQNKKLKKFIYQILHSSSNHYAIMIVSQASIFRAQAAQQFKEKTSKQDLNYIIDNCPELKNNSTLCKRIKEDYLDYQKQYEKNLDIYQQNQQYSAINSIANTLIQYKQRLSTRDTSIRRGQVIANIFSLWSILNANISDSDKPQIIFKPHPAQIVSILLLTDQPKNLFNKLVELKTGEGKSIVLAGLCCYLALQGFKVYCACYSEYLSSRDEKSFKELFQRISVQKSILYGTFNQHCQRIINQMGPKKGDKNTFRTALRQLITDQNLKNYSNIKESFSSMIKNKQKDKNDNILIIDQVDVFFDKNFFGELYMPSINLEDQSAKQLLKKIWKMTKPSRENKQVPRITKKNIMQTKQFKNLKNNYKDIKDLLENHIIGMILAVYDYKHTYTIHQRSLKYFENDAVTEKISYGYKTVFANCHEYEKNNINQISYLSSLKISLKAGMFSYSQLPFFFRNIIGISGTLSTQLDHKLSMIIQKYKISKANIYRIPSIFGQSKRTQDSYLLVNNEQLYAKIIEITKYMLEKGQPCIIFFNSIQQIIQFYKSSEFKQLIDNAMILSEQSDHYSRDFIIRRAGQNNFITIATKSFSRGTDFKIFDESVKNNGGLCIIQTNIPTDYSEYIQIRGRTARQGEKGSFIMVICERQMQKFNIKCNSASQFYKKLVEHWKRQSIADSQNLSKKDQQKNERHKQTLSLFGSLFSKQNFIKYITEHNMYKYKKDPNIRTLIGIDGTSSMGDALQIVKDIVSSSFVRTRQILNEKGLENSFQNKIAIYRNYNSGPEMILQFSLFERKEQNLNEFLSKIFIQGGNGNQAVQVLFQHANSLDDLDQIILITDAIGNQPKQTKIKRKNTPNYNWDQNGFPETDCDTQLANLIQKNIKVHTLYISLQTSKTQMLKKYYQTMSQKTGGICSEFKIKDANAVDFLTAFFVKNILYQIGGQQKGKQLVENYDLKYGAIPLRI